MQPPLTFALLSSAALLAACGGQGNDPATTAQETPTAHETPTVRETSAATASVPAAADSAAFIVLPTAPATARGLTGRVLLSQDRTTLTVEAAGLPPGEQYMGHVHANACDVNAGGPHFQFDPAGGDQPPNEVHFWLTAGQDGTATTTAAASQPLPDTARSVAVHAPGAHGTKLLCADLPGAAAPDPTPTANVGEITVAYAGGQVSGDTGRVPVTSGQPVTLLVTSDVADQVHVHGVDLYQDLQPDATTTLQFQAPAAGIYEVELHDAGTVLTRLQVS